MTQYPRLTVEPIDGRLRFFDADGLPWLDGVWGQAVLADGTVFTTESGHATPEGAGWRITTPGTDARPELRWRVAPEGPGLLVTLELVNTLPYALSLERLDPLVAPRGFLGWPGARLSVAQAGWQSWSFAAPAVPIAQHQRAGTAPKIAPGAPPSEADRLLVPWATSLQAGARRLLIGFVDAREHQGAIAVQPLPGAHRLTAMAYAEGLRVPPGGTWRSEPLLLLLDKPEDRAWARYADTLAARMDARQPAHVSTGWSSWYYFFTEVTEADMRRNLAYLDTHRSRLPISVFQLDDGYQTAIGDWLSLNDKFPSGMRALTDAIREKGFEPGIWVAPFLASETSELFRNHPDWVLQDANGEPINAITNWGTRNFGLDTTHPEVEAWLRDTFRVIVKDWGFDYLKLDFIYAAAMRARRFDPAATSVQAYRRGLAIIREVVGDRFILGCGAPFAPSVGLVDGMRVGPDTAPYWAHLDPHGAEPALLNAIRSTLAHGWMHRRWYVNDPDCVIVRRANSELTPAEVEAWTSVVALSGGMVLFSDDMDQLEPDRAAILPRLLPPSGEAAVPRGPSALGVPTGMQLVAPRPWETWLVAGLFNWSDAERPLVFDPAGWDLPGDGPYHLFDLWTHEHHGPLSGPTLLTRAAPHGVRLLSVHRDLGRPQVVGSTFHLLGEAVELESETWENDVLTLVLSAPGDRRGELYIHVPDGYDITESPAGAIAHSRLIELPFSYRHRETVRLAFKRVT